jgi:hypothetical protein
VIDAFLLPMYLLHSVQKMVAPYISEMVNIKSKTHVKNLIVASVTPSFPQYEGKSRVSSGVDRTTAVTNRETGS